ncbi:MAG: hypothetical protein V3V12_08955 [Gammaproteobacteria bacterium]
MVEEDEYRSTYHAINQQRCIFEKTILTHKCGCSRSTRFFLADREGIRCNSLAARLDCSELLTKLRQKAVFALSLHNLEGDLPYTKEIRIQTGGMLGLQRILNDAAEDTDSIADIYPIILQSKQTYQTLDDLPFQEIVQSIHRFKGRQKNRRNN